MLLHFKDVLLSKEHRDFYVEEKVVLRKTELGDTQELRGRLPGRKSLCSKVWDFTGEGKKKDKDKNKCLMSSKHRASVKQSVHRTV